MNALSTTRVAFQRMEAANARHPRSVVRVIGQSIAFSLADRCGLPAPRLLDATAAEREAFRPQLLHQPAR